MTDNTNTDAADLNVDGAHDIELASYDIADEDAHIVSEIAAMDPAALPSNHEIKGNPKITLATTLDALPPHLRGAAQAKMGARVDEGQAVQAVLRENAMATRAKAGFDASVPQYWHERATLIGEYNRLLDQFDRLGKELTDSTTYEKGEDGQPKAVVGMSEARQRAVSLQQRNLLYQAGLLFDADGTPGPEGQRRLHKAMFDSVQARKSAEAQLAESREIDARARQIAREDRIEAAAKQRAKRYKDTP
jgi:hypothetical protein